MPAKTESTPKNTSTLVKGVVQIGDMTEDTSGTSFVYGNLISSNPKDEDGNAVSNPGAMLIYMPKGLKTGSIVSVLLLKRGLGGLYNYIQPNDEATVLSQLGIDKADVPEIPVVEKEDTSMDRKTASKRSRDFHRKRRELKAQRQEMELASMLNGASEVEEENLEQTFV